MVKYPESKDDVSGWRKQVTSAMAQARVDVDDVSNDVIKRVRARRGVWRRVGAHDLKRRRVEAHGARDQPYGNFERRVGARAVSDDVEAFAIL